jgi:peptidyl-tRNA hydrolase, PTH1 family
VHARRRGVSTEAGAPPPAGTIDSPDLWLVVGLGNPGPGYAGNRHNVGFMVADLLAGRMGSRFKTHKSRAEVVEGRLGGTRVVLAKPRTFMNDSGGPVTGLRDFFKVPLDRLVVVHDELDLPYGVLRLKIGGGDNGHNGLRSLRRSLGSGEFLRVRMGIGRPPGRLDPATFVLRDFGAAERKDLEINVDRAADAVESLVLHGLERAQNTFNT